jgi:cobalamin biosynthesis protein CobD/CbiB
MQQQVQQRGHVFVLQLPRHHWQQQELKELLLLGLLLWVQHLQLQELLCWLLAAALVHLPARYYGSSSAMMICTSFHCTGNTADCTSKAEE